MNDRRPTLIQRYVVHIISRNKSRSNILQEITIGENAIEFRVRPQGAQENEHYFALFLGKQLGITGIEYRITIVCAAGEFRFRIAVY